MCSTDSGVTASWAIKNTLHPQIKYDKPQLFVGALKPSGLQNDDNFPGRV